MITSLLLALLFQSGDAPASAPVAPAAPSQEDKNDHKTKLMSQIRAHLSKNDPERLAKLQDMVWSDPMEFQREIQKVAAEMRSQGLLALEKRHEGRGKGEGKNDGDYERFTKDPVLAARLKKLRQEDPEKFHQEIRRLMEERKNKNEDSGVKKSSAALELASKQWIEAPTEGKEAALAELRLAVTAHFDADFKAKQNCAERISKETERIKSDLEKRRAERDARIEEMLRRITSGK